MSRYVDGDKRNFSVWRTSDRGNVGGVWCLIEERRDEKKINGKESIWALIPCRDENQL